jgi:two-component system, cell cycle sensor histidine kinase and response regulator CckA
LLSLGSSDALSLARIDVREFVGGVARSLNERAGDKWDIRAETGAEPLWVRADREYLKRAVENLAWNAVDAMAEGGTVQLACSAEATGDGGRDIVLRVSDSGGGIPADMLDRIFDPFVSGKAPGKGTGLGLSLTQHIVSLHKGTIAVERTSMLGTTFRIALPEAEVLEVDSDTRWMSSKRRQARVLVLDDDEKIRDVLKSFLRDLKYEVVEAKNGAEAKAELLRYRESCRVLVMDWRIEGEKPGESIRSLRRIREDLIVIVISGYAPDLRAVESFGIRRWFTKPYDRAILDLEIQRALYLADGKA